MELKDQIVIDATGQIVGKVAAKVAKLLLEGVQVTVVCAEEAVFARNLRRVEAEFKEYLNKRCVVNPRRGAFHFREPRVHFHKIVRRMMLYKKYRGGQAMKRLTVHEGIPRELENQPRHKITCSLVKYFSSPENKFVTLGQLLSLFGWKHAELTRKLTEEVREREAQAMDAEKQRADSAEKLRETEEFRDEVRRRLAAYA